MGFVPAAPSRGQWVGDTLTPHSSSPMGQGRYTYTFASDREYHFKIENSFDGGATFTQFMEARYRKEV